MYPIQALVNQVRSYREWVRKERALENLVVMEKLAGAMAGTIGVVQAVEKGSSVERLMAWEKILNLNGPLGSHGVVSCHFLVLHHLSRFGELLL